MRYRRFAIGYNAKNIYELFADAQTNYRIAINSASDYYDISKTMVENGLDHIVSNNLVAEAKNYLTEKANELTQFTNKLYDLTKILSWEYANGKKALIAHAFIDL